jgi:hypothetical protein
MLRGVQIPLLIMIVLNLISNESSNVFLRNVNAVNSDKVSFQVFEIDSSLIDIMWCGNTNEVILV